jgi:hypothetical protein
MKSHKAISLGLWLLFSFNIIYLAYFVERHEHDFLIAHFLSAFIAGSLLSLRGLSLQQLLLGAIAVRLFLIPATPMLSDDYHRFFWDGNLMVQEVHPYQFTPRELWESEPPKDSTLAQTFPQLNSPDYYSVYPPGHQLLFLVAAQLAGGDIYRFIISLRIFLLLFETGTLFLLAFLVKKWRKPTSWMALYAFSPLVLMEIMANLHLEGMMLFFMLLAIALYEVNKPNWSATALGMAIATKLIPLMTLPAWFFFAKRNSPWRFVAIPLLVTALSFIPLLDAEVLFNMLQSLDLYFQRFEFNPSVYAVIREIGMKWTGYNQIKFIGPALGLLSGLGILLASYLRRKKFFPATLAFLWLIYLAFSTIVHPWYIVPPLALGLISGLWFPWVWSATIVFSYLQYGPDSVEQLPWVWGLEYTLVLIALLVDLRLKKTLFHVR